MTNGCILREDALTEHGTRDESAQSTIANLVGGSSVFLKCHSFVIQHAHSVLRKHVRRVCTSIADTAGSAGRPTETKSPRHAGATERERVEGAAFTVRRKDGRVEGREEGRKDWECEAVGGRRKELVRWIGR